MEEAIRSLVYGEQFKSAQTQMDLVAQDLRQRKGINFDGYSACAEFAHAHYLDLIVSSKSQKTFYHVTHHGEIVDKATYKRYYCNDILLYNTADKENIPWIPEGYDYFDRARINGEKTDGIRQPLHHRDYFSPTGYYDPSKETFNVAIPFPTFAKETGRDTSFIYEYINHVAGECAMHVLAWLRHKLLYPTRKTEVILGFISRVEGTGKTTFCEVLCKGLFGKDNVIVSEQFDTSARFNADSADKLIIGVEEKEESDRRNPLAALKSRATASTIRKEHKGIDPVYQEDYSEYIITTNKDVPVKFETTERQRRFMMMEADPSFTRKTSKLADEVFSLLYGTDGNGLYVGTPFVKDIPLIQQFQHELATRKDIANVNLRQFPESKIYKQCYAIPRTNEAIEIEAQLRSLAPFIKASLIAHEVVQEVDIDGEIHRLNNYLPYSSAMLIQEEEGEERVFLCRPLAFCDGQTNKPYSHATIERVVKDNIPWLLQYYGLTVLPNTTAIEHGFPSMQTRYRFAPVSRFVLAKVVDEEPKINISKQLPKEDDIGEGERLRVNRKWKVDPNGEYETVNKMKLGTMSLENKSKNVAAMDTFLLEADETTRGIQLVEQERLKSGIYSKTELIFQERLKIQYDVATRLFQEGIAARVVYSGSKSYHILIKVKDSPKNIEEYKWLHGYLCETVSSKLDFDPNTSDPARLTRAPITFKREVEYLGRELYGYQKLIHVDWTHIYDIDWRPKYRLWLERPLAPYERQFNRRLHPTKPEYKEAMAALLEGTFWTDDKWNGRRQQCFFAGYRLCRYLGYNHDTLWGPNGILDGLEKYYHPNEINYWQTRESCELIQQIDKDIEEMEEYENS